MVPTLFFYHLGLVALVCVFLLLCALWPSHATACCDAEFCCAPTLDNMISVTAPFLAASSLSQKG